TPPAGENGPFGRCSHAQSGRGHCGQLWPSPGDAGVNTTTGPCLRRGLHRAKENIPMKKISKQWTIRLGALALTALCLGTGAAMAAGRDQSDPLVTLRYLNETAIPQVIKQVENSTATSQKELEESFSHQIKQ